MGRSPRKVGLGGVSAAAGEKLFGDRLGYPAISMNFKTESFTYVILLILTHFVIILTLIIYHILQIKQKLIILIYFGKTNAHISLFFLVFTQNLSQYSPDFRKNTAPHASH